MSACEEIENMKIELQKKLEILTLEQKEMEDIVSDNNALLEVFHLAILTS